MRGGGRERGKKWPCARAISCRYLYESNINKGIENTKLVGYESYQITNHGIAF
jgi:hypothetical protein